LATATLALLPIAPYSAGNAMTFRSGFIHWDSMRYIALLPILGWAALGFLIDAGPGASAWRMISAVGIAIAPPWPPLPGWWRPPRSWLWRLPPRSWRERGHSPR